MSNLNLDRLILIGFVFHIALKLVCFFHMQDLRWSGDEQHYFHSSAAMGEAIRSLFVFRMPDFWQTASVVVDKGWFMPGMALLVLPVTTFDPTPTPVTVRSFVGSATLLLLVLAAWQVRKHIGRSSALAIVLVLGLSPMWVLFSLTIWGDVVGGLLLAILAAQLVAYGRAIAHGMVPPIWQAVGIGALLAAMVFARSNTLPVIPIVFGELLFLSVLFLLRSSVLSRAVMRIAVVGFVFFSLILPWSLLISTVLDAPVLTTTSAPLLISASFGGKENMCDGPCPEDKRSQLIWDRAYYYSRDQAADYGTNIVSVQWQMARRALGDLTLAEYLRKVNQNFARHYLHPTGFIDRFVDKHSEDAPVSLLMRGWFGFEIISKLVYFSGFLAFLLVILWPVRAGLEFQVLSLTLKVLALGTATQPFVHSSHGRYWPGFVPLMALSLPFVLHAVFRKRAEAPGGEARRATSRERFLYWTQICFAAAVALFGLAIAVAQLWSV